MLGKPLVGRPIAALAISTDAMTSRFGCGSLMPCPTSRTSGSTMSAATVWLMKVATTRMSAANVTTMLKSPKSPTSLVMLCAMVASRPDELTALPSAKPPAARMMMVHRKLLKSSLVRIPVPKNRTSGMIAITPMSPKMGCNWCDMHQRTMVRRVTMEMNHWIPVKRSLIGRMGTIVVFFPGCSVTRSITQMRMMERTETGSAMKNHVPQFGAGAMFCSAMRFCGLAMGLAMPPMLLARAIPNNRALLMLLSRGRFRSIGLMMLKQSTGAATFDIHMLRKVATNIFVKSTVRGRVPALERTKVAMIFAMLYLDSAAAIVKPPRSSIMTGVHIAAKT